MTLSRRDFLKLGALVTASAALSSCASVYRRLAGDLPVTPWTALTASDFLALNRLTFGPRVDERARFTAIGLQAWVEEQLAFESINDFDAELPLAPFKTLNMAANELEGISNQLFDNYDRETVPNELRRATLIRQLYSKRQLVEVMVEFWSDHFNIFMEKGNCFYLKTVDDREVIRKHALGSFHDLLWASAHSPAMMTYLDNQANHKGAPNENYARELMELHTLSVNGGYTQKDVMELARCLTGWNVKEHFWLGDFVFKEDLHDTGTKNVLGMIIQNDGIKEAERVIEALAAHASTAHFISTKLARRFVADDPPKEIVDKAAQVFLETQGDIKAVLRVILLDGLSLARPKYKRPLNFTLSALRMLNVETDGAALHDYLLRMGQLHFNWPTPDGYPDRSESWQGNLMPRWQFAFELIRNEIPGTKHNLNELTDVSPSGSLQGDVDSLASLLLGAPLAGAARDELIDSVRSAGAADEETLQIIAAGLIASPAFQWR
ncbi:MAG: DUF1800 domain-containing protein [Chloroflexi bacterium]|nr:DUF1800 domain-containing protein [Chloroflexota bacterium]